MKKLLSLVLICAMGFGMISCVESEESPSVENIRNAKAEQLKALAELSRAQAQAAIITAEAEAALKAAQTEFQQNQTAEAKAKFAYEIEKIKAQYESQVLMYKQQALAYEKQVQDAMNALEDAVNDRIEALYAEYTGYVASLNNANNSLLGKKIDLANVEAEIIDITEAANKEIEDNTALVEELEAQLAILTDNAYTQMDKDSLTNEYLKALAAYNDADYKYQSTELAAYNDAKEAAEKASTDFFESIKKKNAELRGASGYGDIIATTTTTGDDYWTGVGTNAYTTIVYYWEKKVLLFDLVDDDNDPSTPEVEQPVMWDDDNDPSTPDVQKFDLVECNEGDEGAYRPQYNGNYIIKGWRTDWYNYTENSFNSILSVDLNEERLASFKNSAVNNYNDNVKTQEDAEKALADVKAAQTAAKGFEKAFADADAARKAIEAFKEAYAKYDSADETVKAKENALADVKKDTVVTGPYLTLINANAALDVLTNKDNEEYGKDDSLVKALADAKDALEEAEEDLAAAEAALKAAAEADKAAKQADVDAAKQEVTSKQTAVTNAQKALDKAIYNAQVDIVNAKAGVKTYEDKVDEAAAAIETAKENEKALLAANTAALAAVETLNNTFGKDSDFYAFYTEIDENGNVVGNSKNCYGYFNEDGNGYWFNDFFEVILLNDDNADGNPDLNLDADDGLYKATNTLSYTDFTAMIANTSPREDEAPVFEDFLKVYDAVIASKTDALTTANNNIAKLTEWVNNWDAKEAELREFVKAKNAEKEDVAAAYDAYKEADKAQKAAKENVDALQAEYQALSTLLTSNGNDDLKNKIREIEGKITTAETAIKDAKLVLANLKTAKPSWSNNYQTIAYKEKLVEQHKAEIAKYEEEIKFYTQMVANAKAALDAELSAQNAE